MGFKIGLHDRARVIQQCLPVFGAPEKPGIAQSRQLSFPSPAPTSWKVAGTELLLNGGRGQCGRNYRNLVYSETHTGRSTQQHPHSAGFLTLILHTGCLWGKGYSPREWVFPILRLRLTCQSSLKMYPKAHRCVSAVLDAFYSSQGDNQKQPP